MGDWSVVLVFVLVCVFVVVVVRVRVTVFAGTWRERCARFAHTHDYEDD